MLAVTIESLEFGEIPNFSRQAEQADKRTYIILYFHMCVCFQYYIKVYNRVLMFYTKIQFTVYLVFDLLACSASLLNF